MENSLELLDILTIISFVLQVQNQSKIIDIHDVQNEVNRALTQIHEHLEMQDDKIDRIMKEVSL